ncbi:MAG TPA: cell division protein FtsA [Acidobacteriaceae bacterium]
MSQRAEGHIAVLDAGSARTRMLIAELHDGALRYLGHGEAPAAGVRRGVISDLKPACASINQAAVTAEAVAQAVVEECVAGMGGPHIRGLNSEGGISLGSRMREITREDVRAAADRARAVSLGSDREMLHLLPRHFILDEQPGIHDPVGMVGHQLEVSLHLSTCSASAHQSLVTCANRAGLAVTETVYEGLAAAEASVPADERELGTCLIDIGAGSSELIVFFEGAVAYTAVIPIGGDHFTNDLAVGLRVSIPEAEWIKHVYGNVVVTSVSESNELDIVGMQGHEPRTVKQRLVSEILAFRARELFQLVRESLRQGGVLEALGAGCVLVGGGARLAGLLDVAESLLRAPARVGTPVPLSRMPQELVAPEYATLIGLLLYAHRTRQVRAQQDSSLRARLRTIFAGSI